MELFRECIDWCGIIGFFGTITIGPVAVLLVLWACLVEFVTDEDAVRSWKVANGAMLVGIASASMFFLGLFLESFS